MEFVKLATFRFVLCYNTTIMLSVWLFVVSVSIN